MNRIAAATLFVVCAVAAAAQAKPQGTGALTAVDVQACLGVSGASPDDQIAACTKIIGSGKIHKGKESDFYGFRGAAYYATRKFDEAEADFDTAIAHERKPEFFFQRALVRMAQDKRDKAREDFAQVVALRPDFAPVYLMRGVASYQDGDYKAALADFDAATQRRQMYYQAIFAKGAAKLRLGDLGGNDDLKQARGMSAHADDEMQALGVTP